MLNMDYNHSINIQYFSIGTHELIINAKHVTANSASASQTAFTCSAPLHTIKKLLQPFTMHSDRLQPNKTQCNYIYILKKNKKKRVLILTEKKKHARKVNILIDICAVH